MNTPRSERFHIGIIGRRNAGKSSLLNTITNQRVSIVSDVLGTTTDPVYKPMEIPGVGAVVFVDTAGYDDVGELGSLRNKKTELAIKKCDLLIYIIDNEDIKEYDIDTIYVVSKADTSEGIKNLDRFSKYSPLPFIHNDENSRETMIKEIIARLSKKEEKTITGSLVKEKNTVLLVMPQDIQAPKGRLILPQVQTIRELLDKHAIVICSTRDNFRFSLDTLKKPPDLIITDSQCFSYVYENKPMSTPLTSFSVLFSKYKGDIEYFISSVKALENISENSSILIAEACTHPPISEDIGRVKIPQLLRKRYGDIKIDFTCGDDFENISGYDLIIHCGSCMFNRKHVISRVNEAKYKNVPMTNYGIVIAYLNGILDKIIY